MIESSPNLALFHKEEGSTTPSFSNNIKSHECVVCSFLPWFKKTDTTFGCPAMTINN